LKKTSLASLYREDLSQFEIVLSPATQTLICETKQTDPLHVHSETVRQILAIAMLAYVLNKYFPSLLPNKKRLTLTNRSPRYLIWYATFSETSLNNSCILHGN